MPEYKYVAVTLNGKRTRGRDTVLSVQELKEQLQKNGLVLLEAREAEADRNNIRLKTREVADFCRQLASLLHAGVPLIKTMTIIAQRDSAKRAKNTYESILRSLKQGMPLSDAMAHEGRAFPELLINMFKSAEYSGSLDGAALKMAEHYDREHKRNSKMRSAAAYPALLLFLIVAVVLVLFTFVLPQFMPLYEGVEIPGSTQFLIDLSRSFREDWLVIVLGICGVLLALHALFTLPKMRLQLDRIKLRLPAVGKLLKTVYTSRFARTFATLYTSGVPMMQAMTIVRNTIHNSFISAQFQGAIEKLAAGRALSQAVGGIIGFDQKLSSILLVGEESGSLEHMLLSSADAYDHEAEIALGRLIALMEPLMIVVMGGIVAFVMISVLQPVYSIYSAIG